MLKRGSRSKARHGALRWQLPVMTSLVLVLLGLTFLFCSNRKSPNVSFGFPKKRSYSFASLVDFDPVVELRNGVEFIWQIPDAAKAVLFLAHGCSGRASHFWDRSAGCAKCIGLPEERRLVLHALSRRFSVLTISSAGKCWTMGKERSVVNDTIRWWVKKHNLEKLPLVALGASSGGYFVSALATDLKFSSIALMIAEGVFDQIDITENYPPTLFVHMPKDIYRHKKISEYTEILRDKGVDVAEIECMEFPLSQNYLADTIPGLNEAVSTKLFKLFQEKGIIDKKGYMKRDGRATPWKEAVKEDKTIMLDRNLLHHVQEELNLAFAYHEMTSVQSEQIFKWFETHMS